MKQLILFVPVLMILLFTSCEEEVVQPAEIKWSKEQSTDLNKELAIQEELDIRIFLEMHKDWKMMKTGSGLQYYIYEEGDVDTSFHPQPGHIAMIEYEISLLDGTICDSTAKDEYVDFKVDNSEIESGVQEAIKLLSIGDRVKLILPSHLAHGLVGDLDKIPPLSTLVMDIHLIGVR